MRKISFRSWNLCTLKKKCRVLDDLIHVYTMQIQLESFVFYSFSNRLTRLSNTTFVQITDYFFYSKLIHFSHDNGIIMIFTVHQ